VYITLRAASKIRDVLAALLLTMGYPSEGLVRVTTTRVIHAFRQHGVRLLLIDDSHFLDVSNKDSRDMLDFLKYLNTELGELGGTMILVGADLHESPLYLDPQINSRLERLTLSAYPLATEDDRRTWQRFLKDAETVLLPYFDCAPPGSSPASTPATSGAAPRATSATPPCCSPRPCWPPSTTARTPSPPPTSTPSRCPPARWPARPSSARSRPNRPGAGGSRCPCRDRPARAPRAAALRAAQLVCRAPGRRQRHPPRPGAAPVRHDIDIPPRELDAVAALAGLDGDAARRLTMNRYPLAIRGHGIQRRHGWRHHFDVVWLCPACTLTTGHTDLLWQTALMPVCLRCRCYLVRAGAAHTS
jgi:hypothetical protein